jgi:hypothetical protein
MQNVCAKSKNLQREYQKPIPRNDLPVFFLPAVFQDEYLASLAEAAVSFTPGRPPQTKFLSKKRSLQAEGPRISLFRNSGLPVLPSWFIPHDDLHMPSGTKPGFRTG